MSRNFQAKAFVTFVAVLHLASSAQALAGQLSSANCAIALLNRIEEGLTKKKGPLVIYDYALDVPVDNLLPKTLTVQKDPRWYKNVFGVYRRPKVAKKIREEVFSDIHVTGTIADADFHKVLEEGEHYAYVITPGHISFGKARNLLENISSKHGVLAVVGGKQDARLSGEMWVEDGVLYYNNDSGTFQPAAKLIDDARPIFDRMGFKKVVGVKLHDKPAVDAAQVALAEQVADQAGVAAVGAQIVGDGQVAVAGKVAGKIAGKGARAADEGADGEAVAAQVNPNREEAANGIARGIELSDDTEAEAKFWPDSPEVLEKMKGLDGRTVTLKDADGKPVTYVFRTFGTVVNRDTYYDTKELSMYSKNATLRERKRYWKKNATKMRDVMFQSKNERVTAEGQADAVFVREEKAGKKMANEDKWNDGLEERIGADSTDRAVQYARANAAGDKPLAPVLALNDSRVYIFAYKVGPNPINKVNPLFQVTLDTVDYEGLIGQKGKLRHLETEVEAVNFLPFGLSTVTPDRVAQLNQLTHWLQGEYGLKTATDSKFVTGMKGTVLPPGGH